MKRLITLGLGVLFSALTFTSCQDDDTVGDKPQNFDNLSGIWRGTSLYSADSSYQELGLELSVDSLTNDLGNHIVFYRSTIKYAGVDTTVQTGLGSEETEFFNNEFEFNHSYTDSLGAIYTNAVKGEFVMQTDESVICNFTVSTPFDSIGELTTILTKQ